jgi:uncharacterized membrane protein YdbT with pleckstrin-like domain
MRTGVIVRRSLEVLLVKVESIEVEQDLVSRVFGCGTVIVGGTGNTRQPFRFVREAERFREKVRQAVEAAQKPEPAKA